MLVNYVDYLLNPFAFVVLGVAPNILLKVIEDIARVTGLVVRLVINGLSELRSLRSVSAATV